MTTKSDIVAAVAQLAGQPQTITKSVMDGFITTLAQNLARGEKVQIAGFGIFEVKATKARVGRNPNTGAAIPIPAGQKITFRAAADLKARV